MKDYPILAIQDGGTHFDECWKYQGHHACALIFIQDLRAEVERWKKEHSEACALVAQMHAAAVGNNDGPRLGVVEDVTDLRRQLEQARAALKVIEWVENDGDDCGPWCPWCGNYQHSGHLKSCLRQLALNT